MNNEPAQAFGALQCQVHSKGARKSATCAHPHEAAGSPFNSAAPLATTCRSQALNSAGDSSTICVLCPLPPSCTWP